MPSFDEVHNWSQIIKLTPLILALYPGTSPTIFARRTKINALRRSLIQFININYNERRGSRSAFFHYDCHPSA